MRIVLGILILTLGTLATILTYLTGWSFTNTVGYFLGFFTNQHPSQAAFISGVLGAGWAGLVAGGSIVIAYPFFSARLPDPRRVFVYTGGIWLVLGTLISMASPLTPGHLELMGGCQLLVSVLHVAMAPRTQ